MASPGHMVTDFNPNNQAEPVCMGGTSLPPRKAGHDDNEYIYMSAIVGSAFEYCESLSDSSPIH